jgi:hypothetical protein
VPLVPQPLLAITFTVPVPDPQVTSMLVLPCPAVMVPLETVQLFVGCGVTEGTLKFTNPPEHHNAGFAVMLPGVVGAPVNVIVLGVLVPGVQSDVLAVTVRLPVVKAGPTFNSIVVLPCPLVMVVPAGLIQL